MAITTLDTLLAGTGVLILLSLFLGQKRPPKPPGPKGHPIIGNLLDVPTSFEWIEWAKWGEKWGTSVS